MTDFASLLVADRGQKARADPPRRQGRLRRLAEEAPRRGPRLARCASLRREEAASRSRSFRAAMSSRWSSAVKNCRRAVALVPRQARREPARGRRTSSRRASQARPRSAGCSRQHRFDAYRSKPEDAERGPRVLVTGEAAQDRANGAPRRGDRAWSATSSTRRPATSARPSSNRRCATAATGLRRAGPRNRGQGTRRGLSADRMRSAGGVARTARRA